MRGNGRNEPESDYGAWRINGLGGFGGFGGLGCAAGGLEALDLAEGGLVGTLGGGGGLVLGHVFGGERFEVGKAFAGDEECLGVKAGFQGIPGRTGLALRGDRTVGLRAVDTAGFGLIGGNHKKNKPDFKKPIGPRMNTNEHE